MAAIVGIVASLVAPVIEIGKLVASPIKRQFTYLCCFDSNIQSLRDEARNLENKREALQIQIDAAENNAEPIIPDVKTWLENADKKIQVDKIGIDREISNLKNGCWDIKSRYRLSREAAKITREMKELVEERKNFDCIARPPLPAAQVPTPLGETYEFQSRKQIEEEIMEALRANEIRTMGICGMGGVGKTTMAKRIMNRMHDENIFQEIFMVIVRQQVDMLKIQDEIAGSLGLKLEETILSARANKLRARLRGANTKRVLVVLDDVWEKLKLDDLGIPCGNERCTILLTSRDRGVLNKMEAQKIYAMEILSKEEAWFLFKEKAGACVNDKKLCSIAGSVAEECKGLPIALITVGRALKDQTTITIWEDALQQLKSANPEDMPDVLKEVYNPLKLSYTYLDNRNAKSLFLLCSLFPEDANISLEDLTLYCMGLRMFCNFEFSNRLGGSLEKLRKRVFTLVDMLKNHFLLLKSRDEDHVRMHDVIRDVAIYIASNKSTEEIVDVKFNSRHSSTEYIYGCVSVISGKLRSLSRLHGLYRYNKFEIKGSSLFGETQHLNVLSFKNILLKSLQLEIQLLKNLRTLKLESCDLGSLSVVGELLNLEILCCRYCSGIVELPVEIGKLNQLKFLDFCYCTSLEIIPPGIVSNLVELEEFKMLFSFGGWGSAATIQGQERRNASLTEFGNLSKLTCLEIEIYDSNLAVEEICFPPNIVKYDIRIAKKEMQIFSRRSSEETYEFQSRKQIEEEIMEALRAKEIRTMGICRMGSVGKTTIAKRIMDRVKDENIFQEICMVVISQEVDILRIQDEIAKSLGLKLEDTILSARAIKLRARLTGSNTKRILIVLDDVWGKLKFDDLGIPCERCTILLTSRSREVLHEMDAQMTFAIKILSEKEAWFLFREKAGTCVDDKNLCSIAKNVVEECSGLPIALMTVRRALKDQTSITFWEDALQQLRSNHENVPRFLQNIYNLLRLSYTYLENRHAKSLFLLCSLFPEDGDISLEVLVSYCIGLHMFSDLDFSNMSEGTLEKVRKKVYAIADMLKHRFLLLEGRDEHHVRMHDVVRDVAIYIASNESREGIADVKFKSLRLSSEYTCEWFSVFSEKKSNLLRMHFAREVEFEIKDFSLFKEMEELNVLSFKNISLKSLPTETQLLKNLRTLRLEFCELESLSVVGELLSLEILDCRHCCGIVELPVEVGKLNQLKLLDFSHCRSLGRIPPGVISNLVELEEFKMLSSFDGWESAAVVQEQERRNASLKEFANLSKLTCLEIEINDLNLAREEMRFPPNVVNYEIRIRKGVPRY